MTFDNTKTKSLHEFTPGSLERVTFPGVDGGEKSLLTLIEEHSPKQTGNPPSTVSEVSPESFPDAPDIVEDEEGYRVDHLMMRLGGNGF